MIPAIWEERTEGEEFEAVLDWLSNGFESAKGQIDIIDKLYDIDNCPEEYLPYLAYFLGLSLEYSINSKEEFLREQIRTAVAWYKLKGTQDGIKLMFLSLGFNSEIKELWWDESYDYDNLVDEKPNTYSPYTPVGGSKSHFFDVVFSPVNESIRLDSNDIVKMEKLLVKVKPLTAILRQIDFALAFSDNVDWILSDELDLVDIETNDSDEYPKFGKEWCLYHDALEKLGPRHNYSDRQLTTVTTEEVVSGLTRINSLDVDNAYQFEIGDYAQIVDITLDSPPLLITNIIGNTLYFANDDLNVVKEREFSVGSVVYKLEVLVRSQTTVLHNNRPPEKEFAYRGESVFVLRDGTITDRTGTLKYQHPNSGEYFYYMHDYNLLEGWDRSCGRQDYFKDGFEGDILELSGDKETGSSQYPYIDMQDEFDVDGDVEEMFSAWPEMQDDECELERLTRVQADVYDWGEQINRGIWHLDFEYRDGSFDHDGFIQDRAGYPLRPQHFRGEEYQFFDRSGSMFHKRDGTYARDGEIDRSGAPLTRETLFNEGYVHDKKMLKGLRRDHGGRASADSLLEMSQENEIIDSQYPSANDSDIYAEFESQMQDVYDKSMSEEIEGEASIRIDADVYDWGEDVTRGIWLTEYDYRDGFYDHNSGIDRTGYEIKETYSRGQTPDLLDRSGSLFHKRDGSTLRDGSIDRSGAMLSREELNNQGRMHNYNVLSGLDRGRSGRQNADKLEITLFDDTDLLREDGNELLREDGSPMNRTAPVTTYW
jgi:phage tail-like protein